MDRGNSVEIVIVIVIEICISYYIYILYPCSANQGIPQILIFVGTQDNF